MTIFRRETRLDATVQAVWDFHMQPDALQRLSPPDGDVRIVQFNPVEDGKEVVLSVRMAPSPFRMRWVARYQHVEPPHRFVDVAIHSPFARWEHHHLFLEDDGHCLMRDEVHYQAPLGALGAWVGGPIIRRILGAQFDHRHRTLGGIFGTVPNG